MKGECSPSPWQLGTHTGLQAYLTETLSKNGLVWKTYWSDSVPSACILKTSAASETVDALNKLNKLNDVIMLSR